MREVIGARVGRLGTSAEQVLALAAVIGRDFDLDVSSLAVGSSEDDVLDVLDAVATAALADDRRSASHVGGVDSDQVDILAVTLERLPPDHPDRALVLAHGR